MHDNTQLQPANNTTNTQAQPTGTTLRRSDLSGYKKSICYAGAIVCFLSELIHLWLLPGQYETFIGNGIVFLLIAMAQGLLGARLLFTPKRRLLITGLVVNTLIILLYLFTHTIGVPVGLAFLPQPFDIWGILATLTELIALACLWLLIRSATVRITHYALR